MRLLTIMVMAAVMHVNAGIMAQGIDLQYKNVSLEEAFIQLQKRSGYDFLYSAQLLKKANPVTIAVKNASIIDIMDQLMANQPLTYVINRKTISIKQKPQQSTIAITGKVTDEKNEPLTGVTVQIKGKSNSVVTNSRGLYEVKVEGQNAVLVFSYLGYTLQEKPVGANKIINVQLVQESSKLNEVVVIGYGEQSRRDLTGAVGEVPPEAMLQAPVISFTEALAGRVAGVSVSAIDGQPGGDPNIVIRGTNSITQSNAPLYVIDGFPIEDFNAASLNMEDIKTFNVLKDASATAIYGSRGANGVIVIETKKGLEGKPVIEFGTSIGMANVTKKMEMMDSYDFVKYQLDLNPTAAASSYLREKTLEDYRSIKGIDWQDQIFKRSLIQSYSLAVRGGNKDTKYAISGSVFKQPGVVLSTGADRYQLRVNIDQNLSKKIQLTLNSNLAYNRNYGSLIAAGDGGTTSSFLLFRTWGFRPITGNGLNLLDEVSDPENISGADVRLNPYITSKNDYTRRNTPSVITNLGLKYNLMRGLQLKAMGTVKYTQEKQHIFFNSLTTQGSPLNPNNSYGVNGSVRNSDSFTWDGQVTLNYNRNLSGGHKLGFMGGGSLQQRMFEQYGYTGFNLLYEQLVMSGLDTGDLNNALALQTDHSLASFFGRFNYGYKSKYLATVTFRADGSSKFPNHRWGYFPSAALAWNMHEEDFLKDVDAITSFKLRGSYGATGNNRVDDFAAYSQMSVAVPRENPSYSFNNGAPGRGLVSTVLGNNFLKWETTWQTDIGFDISAFNDRVGLTVDYYKKDTRDLLLQAEAPRTMGFPSIMKNVGRVQNSGIEVTLNTINIKKKDFDWNTSFNITFNKNKVVELVDGTKNMFTNVSFFADYNATNLYVATIGKPIGLFYGYVFDGVYQYSDFENTAPGVYVLRADVPSNASQADRINIQPGDIKYRDLNGDGVVNDNDVTIIGNGTPIHVGGINNSFRYKNIDLSFLMQWSYGGDVYNANRLLFDGNAIGGKDLNQYASYSQRWTPENNSNTYYRAGGQGPGGRHSSRVIEDGSYIRLKTVSLGYNLSKNLTDKLGISSLRLNVSAQNLLTWTKYSGMDPEVSTRGKNPLTPGFDYSAYPIARTIVFGLNLNL